MVMDTVNETFQIANRPCVLPGHVSSLIVFSSLLPKDQQMAKKLFDCQNTRCSHAVITEYPCSGFTSLWSLTKCDPLLKDEKTMCS